MNGSDDGRAIFTWRISLTLGSSVVRVCVEALVIVVANYRECDMDLNERCHIGDMKEKRQILAFKPKKVTWSRQLVVGYQG